MGLRRGECLGLLGVNGAGKTTTFRLATGELAASSGDALICGESVTRELAAARSHLGYCPQARMAPANRTSPSACGCLFCGSFGDFTHVVVIESG